MRVIVIGETELAIQCAKLLLRRGHEIVGICGPAEASLEVPHFAEISQLTEFAQGKSIDCLFSIVNYQVLPPELLRVPKIAINYHDGPLPRYAGVYATSWAIINDEKQYGVTWHVMVDKVDAGDILQQRSVSVSDDETVHSLNMKCHIAAYRAFSVLLTEIESGKLTPKPQDLSLRTYYGRAKWDGTLISWDWPAEEISRFCRALAFHPSKNLIGEPIAGLNGVPVNVRSVEPCAGSGKPLGTIVAITDSYIQVATADGDVKLREVRSLDGQVWVPKPAGAGMLAGIQ